ncbi:MAG TPA: flagellar type III secretion system protein FlhB [Albidovulum sp.]|uniref:EscU/YscU/HrcU family type III secretion system export apparatus switch protein n=1 Tax=Albidovulum sp. TaxID=1872424 RepID=UPI001D823EBE|nr:flagellar biosynthesis protein FlhB [Paracoccaceae bacterium]MCO5125789.1 flagellar type III secretion system protein FlhB [Paracoccaceae bacterium]HPE23992.1 flagellar type III secretion system protein FlhB [Albidovulum sp.]HRV62097.1 flagellar type III secretion system protein FlhB [Albidovulum sp.]
MSEDQNDKQHEATPQRLREARKRGDVPHSADLAGAAVIGGLLLSALAFGPAMSEHFAVRAGALLSLRPVAGTAAAASAAAGFAPAFIVAALAAIGGYAVQNANVVAPDRLAVKWSRLDPVANAQRRFGIAGLVDLARTLTKLLLFSAALGMLLWLRLPDLAALAGVAPAIVVKALFLQLRDFLVLATVVLIATGLAELSWQRFDHGRRNRMSRQELTDEFRQSEGDPHVKQARRAIALAIANNRMIADVRTADVVVVNPTHYAVALQWKRSGKRAPVCVAKGVDHMAARIREAAALAGVPVRSDPPVARALHASLEIGQEVLPEHYAAVAAAIRFADAMRRRRRNSL